MENIDSFKKTVEAMTRNVWLKRLYQEHSRLVGLINPTLRALPAFKPIIQFYENQTTWGYWNDKDKTIGLNLKLVKNFPWSTVLGILGHETGHQAVSILSPFANSKEGSHGRTFQLYLKRMEIDPVYSGPSVDSSTLSNPPTPFGPQNKMEPNPILEKVQKLLALSSSPEPAEAQAALAAASRLMAKRNVTLNEENAQKKPLYERWILPLRSKRLSLRDTLISQILNENFFVKVIFIYEYDQLANRLEMAMEIVGRPVNLVMAKHVYHFLMERTETLWLAHKPLALAKGEKGLKAKNAFFRGLLTGFRDKLKKAEQHSMRSEGLKSSELILAEDLELDRFFHETHPRIRSTTRVRGPVDTPYSLSAGKEAGEALNIRPPLNSGGEGDEKVKGFLS